MEQVVSSEATPVYRAQYILHPIASIWHRSLAFILDVLILGVIGQAIGWVLWTILFILGPYGRFVGILITFFYFGLFNSTISQGQTFGKKITNIAVRDLQGQPINPAISFIRSFILILPFIFFGWDLPIIQKYEILYWLQLVIVFGLGSIIASTPLLNQKTHQGVHDLFCRTYVVHLTGHRVETYPVPPRRHLIYAMGIGGLAALIITLLFLFKPGFNFIQPEADLGSTSLQELRERLETEERYFVVKVTDRHMFANDPESARFLEIAVWYKSYVFSEERQFKLINDIAEMAMITTDNIDNFDQLLITFNMGYDIAIAQETIPINQYRTIEDWRQRLGLETE